jgi:hypothetical protein
VRDQRDEGVGSYQRNKGREIEEWEEGMTVRKDRMFELAM